MDPMLMMREGSPAVAEDFSRGAKSRDSRKGVVTFSRNSLSKAGRQGEREREGSAGTRVHGGGYGREDHAALGRGVVRVFARMCGVACVGYAAVGPCHHPRTAWPTNVTHRPQGTYASEGATEGTGSTLVHIHGQPRSGCAHTCTHFWFPPPHHPPTPPTRSLFKGRTPGHARVVH
jgi:hypothetical protein